MPVKLERAPVSRGGAVRFAQLPPQGTEIVQGSRLAHPVFQRPKESGRLFQECQGLQQLPGFHQGFAETPLRPCQALVILELLKSGQRSTERLGRRREVFLQPPAVCPRQGRGRFRAPPVLAAGLPQLEHLEGERSLGAGGIGPYLEEVLAPGRGYHQHGFPTFLAAGTVDFKLQAV